MTAAKGGRISDLFVATNTTTPSYVQLKELLDTRLTGSRGFHRATNKDSGGNHEKVSGHGDGNISGSMNHITGATPDPGQVILLDARETGAEIAVRYRRETLSGADEWLDVIVLVTEAVAGDPVDDVMTTDFTMEITGAFARSAQP